MPFKSGPGNPRYKHRCDACGAAPCACTAPAASLMPAAPALYASPSKPAPSAPARLSPNGLDALAAGSPGVREPPAKRVRAPRSSFSSPAAPRGAYSPLPPRAPDSPGANLLYRFGLSGRDPAAPGAPPRTGIFGFLAQQSASAALAAEQPPLPVPSAPHSFLSALGPLSMSSMTSFFTLGRIPIPSSPTRAGASARVLPAPLGAAPLGGGAVVATSSSPSRVRAGALARSLLLQLPHFPPPKPEDIAELAASGASILGDFARGTVVLIPADGGELAFAPLVLARGAATSLCVPPLHVPSSPRLLAPDFAVAALRCSLSVMDAARYLVPLAPMLPLFTIECGLERNGVVLMTTTNGALILRTPRSVPRAHRFKLGSQVGSAIQRARAALFGSPSALGDAVEVHYLGALVTVHFVKALVVKDTNMLSLRALLRHGGAAFEAPPPVRRPTTLAPAAAAAAVAEEDGESAPLTMLRKDVPVTFPNALGIVGEALAALRGLIGLTNPLRVNSRAIERP